MEFLFSFRRYEYVLIGGSNKIESVCLGVNVRSNNNHILSERQRVHRRPLSAPDDGPQPSHDLTHIPSRQ